MKFSNQKMDSEEIIDNNHIGIINPSIKVEDPSDILSINRNTQIEYITKKTIFKIYLQKKRSKRRYAKLTKEQKIKCINEVQKFNKNKVAKKYGITIQTLNRWLEKGIERKMGSGRKPSIIFEKQLKMWCISTLRQNNVITINDLRKKALEINTNKKFKASSAWVENFQKRNNVHLGIINIKPERY